MKQCPRCRKTYTDDGLNFCLDDGEILESIRSSSYAEDSPPTIVMDSPRVTDPINWASPSPMPTWQPQGMQNQPPGFAQYGLPVSPSQTLAVVSLGLGIASMTIGWCCYLGVLLSPAALITGFIALSQIKKDPDRYTGRGLAIGGIVTAAAYFALLILVVIIYGAARLANIN